MLGAHFQFLGPLKRLKRPVIRKP